MTDKQPCTDKQDQGPIRILSLDGGGIYGMTGALWLRQLCEKDKCFLNGEDVHLFVGCSSGACNALLLAMHDRPREVVLDGVLERFWAEPGTFSNTNPLGALLSFTGQVGWFGEDDFRRQLGEYMGRTRLNDLKQCVLISTYDWYGRKHFPDLEDGDPRPGSEHSFDRWAEAWRKAASQWTTGWEDMAHHRGDHHSGDKSTQSKPDWDEDTDRHWKPKFFDNLGEDPEDGKCLIAEIAYGAATPPGFRALRGGIGDGASFSANPSVHGIAAIVSHYRPSSEDEKKKIKQFWKDYDRGSVETPDEQKLSDNDKQHDTKTGPVLLRIRMLSLGDGTRQPYFWQPNSNYGFRSSPNIPANPWMGLWYGPGSYALQASDEESKKISRELLGRRYFRLNPGANDLPTVLATYYARWPQMRAWILQHIRLSAADKPSRDATCKTLEFLRSERWKGEKCNPDANRSDCDTIRTKLEETEARLRATQTELEAARVQLRESKLKTAGQ